MMLRGHHLLCIQGFQGYGYSEDFVLNMAKIKDLLENSNQEIVLTNTPDDICKFCPNLNGNICINEKYNEKIVKMDEIVLNKLSVNNPIKSNELFNKLYKLFTKKKDIKDICNGCEWLNKCLFVQKFQK